MTSFLTYVLLYISMGLLVSFISMTISKYLNIKDKDLDYKRLSDDQVIITTLASIFWPLAIILGPIFLIGFSSIGFIKNSSTALAKFIAGKND